MIRVFSLRILPALLLSGFLAATASAQEEEKKEEDKPAPPKHVTILKDAKSVPGLIPVYHKGESVFAELSSSHYSSEFIVLISIARGIGQGQLLGGMSWGFGDDWVWQFRKVDDDRILLIRKNVRFKASKGTPEASAVENAYTDSVLFSMKVLTKGPKGGDLVDLTPIFMSDLPQISDVLAGFSFSASKSTWEEVKGFEKNLELTISATYASSGRSEIESVPDSRGVSLGIHYSISKIPTTGYTPRLADPRVGYFLTVVKDYSSKSDRDQFVRYINRWNLQKADPKAKVSPPKEPLVFWLEKTIPYEYRRPIREGILEWNKAFEAAGLVNAIEVRQQPDDATWDPEDINYNTFRWITSSAGFAMGPSRVNPYTGQILDADIIFDADFVHFWKQEYETLEPKDIAALTGGGTPDEVAQRAKEVFFSRSGQPDLCRLNSGMAHQFALGSTALMARLAPEEAKEVEEKLILQGLKEVAMHEVGHTLGLRHNFKASTFRSLKDLNEKGDSQGLVASVMDYAPTNIVPKDQKQGDFFTTTVGPYDIWAIEYGYTPFSGGEEEELKKIASRSGEPGLAYATDEDTSSMDPDPHTNRFDLGDDAVAYAQSKAQLVKELMPGLVDRMTEEGDDYTNVRRAFNILLSQHGQGMYFASRYIGGMFVSRSFKGDKDAPAPITLVDAAKQREALALLEEQVFSDDPYQVPPELYNHLAASNWRHWGVSNTLRKDFPVHQVITMWQTRILGQLLSSITLERIHDSELKVPADQDAFTAAELIQRLTKAIYAEVDDLKDGGDYTNRKPAISSIRRNLQRIYLRELAELALGNTGAPDDCQTIAYVELSGLEGRIEKLLGGKTKLDPYTQAHLQESSARIRKVLDSRLTFSRP